MYQNEPILKSNEQIHELTRKDISESKSILKTFVNIKTFKQVLL